MSLKIDKNDDKISQAGSNSYYESKDKLLHAKSEVEAMSVGWGDTIDRMPTTHDISNLHAVCFSFHDLNQL